MKKTIPSLLLFMMASFVLYSADAQSPGNWKEDLLEAEAHFHQGLDGEEDSLIQAVRDYQAAVDSGAPKDFRIYYNMGNALYLSGFSGEAALMYRQALFYKPNDKKTYENLNYILEQGGIEAESPWGMEAILYGSIYAAGFSASLYAGFFLFSLAWISAAVGLLSGKRIFMRLFFFFFILSLWNTGICLLWKYNASETGVILSEGVTLRKGDSRAYEPVQSEELAAGVRFRLLEEREGWIYIRLPDKSRGWVEADDTGMILQAAWPLDS
jgi:hypothetical protein